MAETKDIGRQGGPNLAADYKNKGAIGVLKTIVSHRGWCGLYTGLGLHTRKLPSVHPL